ncbi:MAG: 4-oxalocrotonate tautomerase [Cyanobacteria bacterium P01_G01_bin.54]
MPKPTPTLLSLSIALLTLSPLIACSPAPAPEQEQTAEQSATQWQDAGTIPLSVESHQTVVVGNRVYMLGGWNSRTYAHDEVFFADLTAGGTLTDWQEATAPLPLKLQHHQAITHKGAIYVIGGDDQFGPKSNVSDRLFRAVPEADGDITEWQEVGQLPEPRTVHGVAIVGDRLYVIGGTRQFEKGTEVFDTVFAADIAPDGMVGEFETLAPFPTTISWLTTTVVGEQIVAIAGKTDFSGGVTGEIWSARLEESGELSEFAAIGETVARQRHTTVRVDDQLVVIAGGAKQVLATVEAAALEEDGSLGDWQALPPLPAARYAHAAFVHDGSIYVSGGFVRYGSGETSDKVFRLDVSDGF